MNDERDTAATALLRIERRGIDVQKALARIVNLKLMPRDTLAAGAIHRCNLFPIQLRQETANRLAFRRCRQTE